VSVKGLRIKGFKLTVNSTSRSMVTIKIPSKSPPTDQRGELSETAQEQTFLIHKDFICYYSEFFAVAFNGQFKEGQTQSMTLDDIDPEAFALLVDWLYYQRIESDGIDLPTLARLWIMGGRFLLPAVQNSAIDSIYRTLVTEGDPGVSVEMFRDYVRIANGFSAGENPLVEIAIRKLCITSQDRFDLWVGEVPPEMQLKVTRALKRHYEGLSSRHKIDIGKSEHYYV
jgi:hypothetical protein